jgi:hypothetical protein
MGNAGCHCLWRQAAEHRRQKGADEKARVAAVIREMDYELTRVRLNWPRPVATGLIRFPVVEPMVVAVVELLWANGCRRSSPAHVLGDPVK